MPGGPPGAQMGSSGTTISSLESLVRAAEKDDLLLYLTAFCGVFMPGFVYILYHYLHKIYIDYSKKREDERLMEERERSAITIFYASDGNESERLAQIIAQRLSHESPPVVDLSTIDVEDFCSFKGIGIFVISSARKGREPDNVEWFFDWLEEIGTEKQRSNKQTKQRGCRLMHFAILGIDTLTYERNRFNRAARTLARRLRAIGAKPLCSLRLADRNQAESLDEQTDAWADRLLEALDEFTVPVEHKRSMRFFSLQGDSSADSYSSGSEYESSVFRNYRSSGRRYQSKRHHIRGANNNMEQSDLSEEEDGDSNGRDISTQWSKMSSSNKYDDGYDDDDIIRHR